MGAIRINLSSGSSFLLNIDPAAAYSIANVDTAKLVIQESIGAANTFYEIDYVNVNEKWPEFIQNGLQVGEFISPNPSAVLLNYAGPAIMDIIVAASQGDEVVDLAFPTPALANSRQAQFSEEKNETEDKVTNYQTSLTQAISEQAKAGQTEYRLPDGGGIIEIATWTSDDSEAYAERIFGNSANVANKYMEYDTVSIFEAVSIS